MSGGRALIVFVLSVFAAGAPSLRAQSTSAKPAAIVASLSGSAWTTVSGSPARAVHRFDWLPEGASIRTDRNTEIVVVTHTGRRYRLGPLSRATITSGDARKQSGSVERLEDVPPLPVIGRLSLPGSISAVRVRASGSRRLYPDNDSAVRAQDAVLMFDAPGESGPWTVEVIDETGRVVFEQRLSVQRVTLSGTLLAPGRGYQWRVITESPAGFRQSTAATLSTLSADVIAARDRAAGDTVPRLGTALLAMVDLHLGLAREAHAGLLAARAEGDGGPDIETALARLEQRFPFPSPRP